MKVKEGMGTLTKELHQVQSMAYISQLLVDIQQLNIYYSI